MVLSLKELCIRVVYQHQALFTSLHILPGELVDQVFQTLAKMTALSDAHLAKWKHAQTKEFDFSNCKYITDSGIKDFVQRFAFLESLKLGESGVTSQSITHVANHCTSLITLDISDISLKESDFNSLKKCTTLKNLICKKNSGLKAKGLGKLLQYWPRIEYGEAIFPTMPTAKHLTHFHCASFTRGNTKASTESVQYILDNCPTLLSLDISCYMINICALHSTNLRTLDISCTAMDTSPDNFISLLDTQFPSIECLRMSDLAGMKGHSLSKLATNTTLRELSLKGCISVESGCIERWGNATSSPYPYTSLSLSGCKDMTDSAFASFAKSLSPSLTTLDLSGVWKLNTSLQVVAENCPHLTSLDLSVCKIMTNDSITTIARNCRYLKALELYACKNVTDDAIIELAENCPELTYLRMYNLPLTDKSVGCFGNKLHHLTSLDVSCSSITDASLRNISLGCPLVSFNAIGCHKVTDAGIIQLVRNCLNMQHMSLNDCKQLTNACLKEMAHSLQFLRELNMLGCELISGEGILELGRHCHVLRTLRLSSGTPITTPQIQSLFSLAPLLTLKL